jgi:signal transduction histidine kinase
VTVVALAAVVLLLLRARALARRLERVARAEHEIRGAATALGLILRGDAARFQLDRLAAGLADLRDARGAGAPGRASGAAEVGKLLDAALAPWGFRRSPLPPLRVAGDRGRLAQAVGNLVANAAEHGGGELDVTARPAGAGRVRLELRNPRRDRGRGLAIAELAAREAGGSLDVAVEGDEVVAALELPAA